MNLLKAYLRTTRPGTLILSLSGIVMSGFIAYADAVFNPIIFALTLSTAILLQLLADAANDLGDYLHGADSEERIGEKRGLQNGEINYKQMKKVIYCIGGIALLSGSSLILYAFKSAISDNGILFFAFGGIAVLAAIKYTLGKYNYGYVGLADGVVFLFFGIAAVSGAYFCYAQDFYLLLLLPSTSIGALSAAVLNVNNMRDIESDAAVNKNTLAVKLGAKKAKIFHYFLVSMAQVIAVLYVFLAKESLSTLLLLPALILLNWHQIRIYRITSAKDFDPELKLLSLNTLLLVISIGVCLLV